MDWSWALALSEGRARGWHFGSDVVFPFGPLGFAWPKMYHPATASATLVLWVAFALVFWFALFELAREQVKQPLLAWPLLVCVTVAASVAQDAFLFSCVSLVPLTYFGLGRVEARVLYAVTALVAVASLVKFSILVMAAYAVGCVGLDVVLKTRRPPRVVVVYASFVAAAWLASGQRLSDFVPYVLASAELARGYAPAMAADGPASEVIWYLVSASMFLVAVVASRSCRSGAAVFAFAGLLFLEFRTGFVRQDAHALAATAALFVLVVLYGAAVMSGCPEAKPKVIFALSTVLTVCALAAGVRAHRDTSLWGLLTAEARRLPANAAAALAMIRGADTSAGIYDRCLQGIRERNPVPTPSGSVDIYPSAAAVAVAHGFDYRPRPTLQSYAAYTEDLQRRNASFLDSERGPESVLFAVAPIDDRVPALDDAASWPVLLAKYDPCDMRAGTLLLRRSAVTRPVELKPLTDAVARLGEPVDVPAAAGRYVWVKIFVKRTLLGSFGNQVFRVPPLVLRVELADGSQRQHRFASTAARAGFLLSPFVRDSLDFARLFDVGDREPPTSVRVVRFWVEAPGGAMAWYRPEYVISFDRLEVGDPPAKGRWQSFANLSAMEARGWSAISAPSLIADPAERMILYAHAPSAAPLDVPRGAARVRLRFGILDGAWQGGNRTSGAEFRVSVDGPGGRRVIWSRYLDPLSRGADRGEQESTVDVPAADAGPLVLETLPGEDGRWDWTYWSGAEFE